MNKENKYQEALNKIKNMGDKDLFNEFHIEWANTLQKLIDEHQQLKEENQKLKDKETPKKPIRHLRSLYRCENCEEIFQNHHYQDYCPACGQKLDWSDE